MESELSLSCTSGLTHTAMRLNNLALLLKDRGTSPGRD
jgi:hypothetical protein